MATKKKTAKKKPVVKKAPTKKPVAKKKAVAKKTAKKLGTKKAPAKKAPAKKKPITRRDASGHLDPKYAASLRRLSKESGPESGRPSRGFLKGKRKSDDVADLLGGETVRGMTSGEYDGEDEQDQIVAEERGGPFIETKAKDEFAYGIDKSNPKRAKREPFPTT